MAGSKPRKGQRKCAGSSGGRESGAAALAMVQVGSGALAVGGGGGGQREESRSHPGGTLLGPGCCSAMGHPRTVQGWAGAGLKGRGRQALQSDGFQGKKAA